jgi:hypothetical protein
MIHRRLAFGALLLAHADVLVAAVLTAVLAAEGRRGPRLDDGLVNP